MKEHRIYEISPQDSGLIAPLFGGMDDTTIWSCFQGRNSSRMWADSPTAPTSARVQLGGIERGSGGFGFVAGDCDSPAAEALVRRWPQTWQGSAVVVPKDGGWCSVIERVFGEDAVRTTRYATSKQTVHFDRDRLREWAAALPSEYELRLMDGALYDLCRASSWSFDNVANFATAQEFEQYGMGIACMHGGELVGVASAYSAYDKGIEIEIDTREDHRRRGIARANASRLILECLDRGLYPSWDAANSMSLALAQSLGYVFEREYPAYYIPAQALHVTKSI